MRKPAWLAHPDPRWHCPGLGVSGTHTEAAISLQREQRTSKTTAACADAGVQGIAVDGDPQDSPPSGSGPRGAGPQGT